MGKISLHTNTIKVKYHSDFPSFGSGSQNTSDFQTAELIKNTLQLCN